MLDIVRYTRICNKSVDISGLPCCCDSRNF